MADFITIRRRDTSAEPLLAPNRDIYLRENIRSRLLVPRRPSRVTRTRPTSNRWKPCPPGARLFRHDRSGDQGFPEELDSLSQQSISMDVPDQLKSQPLLEK